MPQEKRRWQFSLRDVLLLMLIVGLGVGWFVDHRRLAAEIEQQQAQSGIWFTNLSPVYSNDLRAWFDGTITNQPAAIDPAKPDEAITDPPPDSPMP